MTNPTPNFQVAQLIQQTAAESIRRVYALADQACALYEPLQQLADSLKAADMPFRLGNFCDYVIPTLLLEIETVSEDERTDRAIQEFIAETGWELQRSEPKEPAGCDVTIIHIWLRHPPECQAINLMLRYQG